MTEEKRMSRLIDADAIPWQYGKDGDIVVYPDTIAQMPTMAPELEIINWLLTYLYMQLENNERYQPKEIIRGVICDLANHLGVKAIVEQIDRMPTIESERKTGRWVKATGMMPPEHTGRHCCSECDEFAPVDWKTHKEELTDYCPHCGLKME